MQSLKRKTLVRNKSRSCHPKRSHLVETSIKTYSLAENPSGAHLRNFDYPQMGYLFKKLLSIQISSRCKDPNHKLLISHSQNQASKLLKLEVSHLTRLQSMLGLRKRLFRPGYRALVLLNRPFLQTTLKALV